MKRTVLTLVGFVFLSSIAFVSCKDNLLDGDGDSKGEGEVSPYRTVQDSVFMYRDGKLSSKSYYYYDSDGTPVRQLNMQYDTEGNLTVNQEGTYTYKSYRNNHTEYVILWNNNGLKDDAKEEYKNVRSDNNSSNSRKNYVYHDSKWILVNENYSESNKKVSKGNSASYAMYNGEMIIVSSSKTERKYNSSGMASSYEYISYRKDCYYDNTSSYSSNDLRIIQEVYRESWNKQTTTYDSKGRTLKNTNWTSVDSINWTESSEVFTYKEDSKGNEVERIRKEDGSNDYKYTWAYDKKNNILKEQHFNWSESDLDFILQSSVDYTYSASGKLISVEINSESNNISIPQTPSRDESDRVIYGFNRMGGMYIGGSGRISGARCSITCDANGYPVMETLYEKDSDGNMVEIGRCDLAFDSKGICLRYVVEQLEDGEWKEVASQSQQITYDSNGNIMSQHSNSSSTYYYSSTWYSYSVFQESESISKTEYNSLGYMSYRYYKSTSHSHYEYSTGQVNDSSYESVTEYYYSTIKVE